MTSGCSQLNRKKPEVVVTPHLVSNFGSKQIVKKNMRIAGQRTIAFKIYH